MMHDNSWGFGMGWGMWIIPLAVIRIMVFLLRGKRKKYNECTGGLDYLI